MKIKNDLNAVQTHTSDNHSSIKYRSKKSFLSHFFATSIKPPISTNAAPVKGCRLAWGMHDQY
ncbi:hypothetical protein, partial [Candidatus Erwinia dacicola]